MKTRRVLLAAAAGLILAAIAPISAQAHVSVSPNSAAPGSYTLLTVKVPNESASATTNRLVLKLPTDTPIASVSYVPVPGWNVELEKTTLPSPVKVGENQITEAVTQVVWTALPGSEITAGQLQIFPVSLGPIPNVDKLVFTALQSYSDGSVVSWSDTESGAEHPAPTLYVTEAPTGDHHDAATSPSASGDTIARSLVIGSLVLSTIGIVIAATALRRIRGEKDA